MSKQTASTITLTKPWRLGRIISRTLFWIALTEHVVSMILSIVSTNTSAAVGWGCASLWLCMFGKSQKEYEELNDSILKALDSKGEWKCER